MWNMQRLQAAAHAAVDEFFTVLFENPELVQNMNSASSFLPPKSEQKRPKTHRLLSPLMMTSVSPEHVEKAKQILKRMRVWGEKS